jgi:hypothetical protein
MPLRHGRGVRLRGSGSARNIRFSASCSPLVEGKVVLPIVGGKGASVVTFDKDSDEATWKALADQASYAPPTAPSRVRCC